MIKIILPCVKPKQKKVIAQARQNLSKTAGPAGTQGLTAVSEQTEQQERLVGKVVNFYSKISVAAVELSDTLSVGDTIHIRGNTTDLRQTVDSMQIEHETVQTAGAGDSVGIKVSAPVRRGDQVFVVE